MYQNRKSYKRSPCEEDRWWDAMILSKVMVYQVHLSSSTTRLWWDSERNMNGLSKESKQQYVPSLIVIFSVLSVLMQWVKNHYYDFSTDPELLIGLKEFLDKNISTQGKLILQHRKYCKNILVITFFGIKSSFLRQPLTSRSIKILRRDNRPILTFLSWLQRG